MLLAVACRRGRMDPERRIEVAAALEERAERLLADVREQFGDAPRREPLDYARHHDPDEFPRTVDEQIGRLAGIAGAVVTDEGGRVFCVDVNYKEVDWQTPGGAVEPGDSLPGTARKEVHEETGVEVALDGLLYTRRVHYDYGESEPAVLPMAIFTGSRTGGETRVPDRTIPDGREEIADVRWFAPGSLPETTLDYEWVLAHCEGRAPPTGEG